MSFTMSQHKPDIIIYHGGCPDGIAGAWCFWQKYNDSCEYFPARFNQEPPNTINKHVIIVDFSYSVEVTRKIAQNSKSLTVLDHHKSATQLVELGFELKENSSYSLTLDMTRSGAQIAWDYLNPTQTRPWFIDDIGDRDLWAWKVDGSRATTRAMFGLQLYSDFEAMSTITSKPRSHYLELGQILLTDDDRRNSAVCKNAIDCYVTASNSQHSYKCRVVECDRSMASDVGNILVQDDSCDFSVMWRYVLERDEWCLSCRSKSPSIDLTKIVPSIFGNGGGHPCASGCTIYGSKKENLRTYFKPVGKSDMFNK